MDKLFEIKKLIEQLDDLTHGEEYRSVISIDGRWLSVECFCKSWMLSLVSVLDSVKDCSVYIDSNTHFKILFHA